ncbi:glycoside hydrolase family 16 protein [Dendrothele bispora CBS 962.96]|uniref:Glycoside hydrolase family 16 protein n=1 Tax=Dendrothele bispora (strain CBS 962.96) TaxID=1314807 RepID=A0A4S8MID1_DENBC|nr:glycoside hydrolase family 16 protein [Dendrothele bispora CBS 962.96]
MISFFSFFLLSLMCVKNSTCHVHYLSLPILSLAGNHNTWSIRNRHHGRSPIKARKTQYTLEDHYQGQDFLDQWNFFSNDDPTHGLVDYQSKGDAVDKGLAYVQGDGTAVLKVDNSTWLGSGQNRASVRISTKKKYNGGLFIADIYTMPHGCSLWPAYWSVGSNWPNGGEIDILEGVNMQTNNQLTVHSSEGCSIVKDVVSKLVSADISVGNLQCASSGTDNTGCAFHQDDTNSYGHGFNINGGGVFAHLWNSQGITVWFFTRSQIPSDITSGNPNPDNWGTPSAFWAADSCSMDHFSDHALVFDTTLCGDWAGATFSGDGCPGTCSDYIKDPSNFHTAHWKLNYVSVYQSS